MLTKPKGIPESVENARRQAPVSSIPAATAVPQTSTESATSSTRATPTAEAAEDAPINLFEAAAQAGRGATRSSAGAAASPAAGGGSGAAAAAAAGLGAGAAGATAAGGLGNLDFLRQNTHFQQLRQVVQSQPHMLEPILQQVGAGNPQLAALIGQNPDQFLQLLSEDVDEDAPMPPGAQTVNVTEEEREAIERVCISISVLP